MNRRQLALVIILNALISLAIAVSVVWVVEQRRPDPETLAALATPILAPMAAPTFTPTPAAATPAPAEADAVAHRIGWLDGRSESPALMCGPLAWAILNDARAFPPGYGGWVRTPKSFWLPKPSENGRPWSLFPPDTYTLRHFDQPLGTFDLRATPVADRDCGVRLHADVCAALARGAVLRRAPWWADLLLALLATGGIGLAALRLHRFAAQVAVAMFGAVAVAGLAVVLLTWAGVWIALVAPLLGALLGAAIYQIVPLKIIRLAAGAGFIVMGALLLSGRI